MPRQVLWRGQEPEYLCDYKALFYKNVYFLLNIPATFGIITIASSLPLPNWGEVADSGEPHVVVSADTQKSRILLNISHVFTHFGV